MNLIFVNDCAADGCKKRNMGNGIQLCKKHEQMYESGIPFKGFHGRTLLKKEFQKKSEENGNTNR